MAITITDPALLALFEQAKGYVEIMHPDGRLLGSYLNEADNFGKPPPGFKSPFTDEQLAEFSKQRTGRPLADILRDLEQRGQG